MRRLLFTLIVSGAIAAPLAAQQTPAPSRNESAQAAAPSAQTPQAAPPAPARLPSAAGPVLQGANVRLEITITDTYNGTPQTKKTTMTVMSGQTGMIRTDNHVFNGLARVRLNVDAMLVAYQSGQISTRVTVNYLPPPRQSPQNIDARTDNTNQPGILEESINVVLMDGVTMLLSESADPATDRKVTLEAKATILK